jgi:hypothetical protein
MKYLPLALVGQDCFSSFAINGGVVSADADASAASASAATTSAATRQMCTKSMPCFVHRSSLRGPLWVVEIGRSWWGHCCF